LRTSAQSGSVQCPALARSGLRTPLLGLRDYGWTLPTVSPVEIDGHVEHLSGPVESLESPPPPRTPPDPEPRN
jgi:hypothetical protein